MLKISRTIYLIVSWLFVVGVLTQVFLAGMVVVAAQWGWDRHIGLGHTLALPLLLMVITAYLGRLPRTMKRLTWLLFLVYIVQADVIIFMRGSAPVVAAFHPVLALVDFALGVMLAVQARALVQTTVDDHLSETGDLEPAHNRDYQATGLKEYQTTRLE